MEVLFGIIALALTIAMPFMIIVLLVFILPRRLREAVS